MQNQRRLDPKVVERVAHQIVTLCDSHPDVSEKEKLAALLAAGQVQRSFMLSYELREMADYVPEIEDYHRRTVDAL